MSGYKRPPHHLAWPEDHDLHGLEADMRRLDIGALVQLQDLADQLQDRGERSITDVLADVAKAISGGLLGWNLTDDNDVPIGTTADDVAAQDFPLIMGVLLEWLEVATSVPLASRARSSSGAEISTSSTPEPPEDMAAVLAEFQDPLHAPA